MATGRHFSMSGHHYLLTYKILMISDNVEFLPISTTFDMSVDYDVPNWFLTSKNFYRSPFSKWPPQYRTNSILFDFNVLNWFPTSKNFYQSPFSKLPPQYRKNSTLFDFKGSFWFIFVLWRSFWKWRPVENFSMSGINSRHHYLPTYQILMISDNVEFLPPIFYAVFLQSFWKWQTFWKFWKRRIFPLMVTYH
jgi:hypothetical protein